MTFKKLTIEEIKYNNLDNLIGIPMIEEFNQDKNIIKRSITYKKKKSENEEQNFSKYQQEGEKIPIIIDIIENFKFSGEKVIESEKEQWISIKNISAKDKLWNLQIHFKNNEYHYKIPELMPNEHWRDNLYFEDNDNSVIEENALICNEKISKLSYISDDQIEDNFYLDSNKENNLFYSIIVKNNSKNELRNIHITKQLPDNLLNLDETIVEKGRIDATKKQIIWLINDLGKEESSILKFKLKVKPRVSSTGKILIQYQKQITNEIYKINSFTGNAKTAQLLNIDERDAEPGVWDCFVEFINQSDYKIQLNDCTLFLNKDGNKQSINTLKKNQIVEPYERVKILNSVVKQEDAPNLIKKIEYSPLYKTNVNLVSNIEIEDKPLEVIDLRIQKKFSTNSVKSFVESDFNTTILLENLSTIPINHIMLEETIPIDFSIDDISKITLDYGKNKISLNEFSKNKNFKNITEEIEYLEKKKSELKENRSNLETELTENNNQIKAIELKLVNITENDFNSRESEIVKEIDNIKSKKSENEKEIKKLNSEIKDLDKQIEENKTIISENLENQKLADNKNNLEIKISKNDEQSETIKKQMESLEKENKKIEVEIENLKPSENMDEKTIDKKKKQLKKTIEENNKKIKSNTDEIKELKKKNDDISKDIAKIEKNIPKDFNYKKISSENKKIEKTINKITSEIDKNKKTLEKILKSVKDIEKEIENKEDLILNLKENAKQNKELNKELSEVKSKTKNISNKLKDINKEINYSKNRLDFLNVVNAKLNTMEQKQEIISNYFHKKVQENSGTIFEPYILESNSVRKLMLLFINLDEIKKSIEPDKTLQIIYPIKAIKPRYDANYKFPSKITINYDPVTAFKDITISNDQLPTIDVIHKRKKLALGKVIEAFSSEGKFAVTILVKNNSTQKINNINIIDKLPKSAEILNSYNDYEEEIIDDLLKQVVWKIKSIPPLEETQISYIVQLKNMEFDLNQFEIKTE